MTQKQHVLSLIESFGDAGICGTKFLEAHIPRYAARVHELRSEGHEIERFRCTDEWHRHRSVQWKYRKVG